MEGGKNKATVEIAPWFVAIFQLYDMDYQFICVGSLIAPHLVISGKILILTMYLRRNEKLIK